MGSFCSCPSNRLTAMSSTFPVTESPFKVKGKELNVEVHGNSPKSCGLLRLSVILAIFGSRNPELYRL